MSTEATPLSSTPRTTLRRHRERGQADRAALYAVLDAGLICHLGVVSDGAPVVLPTAYGREGDTLYLHGSSANGAFWAADGQQVCVTVTHMDGLVAARSVFSHSVNYRSAVIFGKATLVTDPEAKMHGLKVLTDTFLGGMEPLLASKAIAVPVLYWTAFVYHFFTASEISMLATSLPILMEFAKSHGLDALWIGMVWTFAAGGKLFAYQSAPLIVGYAYGYFRHTDMLKLGAILTVVEFLALLFCTGIYWPLFGF